MNRYAARGLIEEALLDRKRVLVLTQDPIISVLDEIQRVAPEGSIVKVLKVNGAERVDFDGGGHIRVMRWSRRDSSLRGLCLDIVYLDSGVDERVADPIGYYGSLRALIATSANGRRKSRAPGGVDTAPEGFLSPRVSTPYLSPGLVGNENEP